MTRHAYMIMAHHKLDQLGNLLSLLDDERNDVYVHVDASAGAFDREALELRMPRGTLTFTDRVHVQWGAYSQVAAGLVLLRAATATPHDHYHLLSGADLPLGTPNELHAYFAAHAGEEFVHFELATDVDVAVRVRYWHPLQEWIGQNPSWLVGKAGYALLRLQQLLGVDRRKRFSDQVVYGSSWYSITDALAREVVARAPDIRRRYRMTQCPDEQFLQTLVWNSSFRDRLHQDPSDPGHEANARLVDFARGNGRGNPYTFRESDFDEVMGSGRQFARKFDSITHPGIIDRITDILRRRSDSQARVGDVAS